MLYKIGEKWEMHKIRECVSACLDAINLRFANTYQQLCCRNKLTVRFKSLNENIVKKFEWKYCKKCECSYKNIAFISPEQNKYLAKAFQPSTLAKGLSLKKRISRCFSTCFLILFRPLVIKGPWIKICLSSIIHQLLG